MSTSLNVAAAAGAAAVPDPAAASVPDPALSVMVAGAEEAEAEALDMEAIS
jgi:hypothetical protein